MWSCINNWQLRMYYFLESISNIWNKDRMHMNVYPFYGNQSYYACHILLRWIYKYWWNKFDYISAYLYRTHMLQYIIGSIEIRWGALQCLNNNVIFLMKYICIHFQHKFCQISVYLAWTDKIVKVSTICTLHNVRKWSYS